MIDARDQLVSSRPPASTRRQGIGGPTARSASGKPAKPALQVERVFSDPKLGPFAQMEWEKRTAEITDERIDEASFWLGEPHGQRLWDIRGRVRDFLVRLSSGSVQEFRAASIS